MRFYLHYKDNGLYDPVLDDQEIIFEPIEPEDFGQSSESAELFTPIAQLPPLDLVTPGIPESRSQTASPFVLPAKPYRPFSTEPILEVPPLEEPIILNPNYHDEFGKQGEDDFLPKSKFKLPISEQYDPSFGKEKKVETMSKASKKDDESLKEKISKDDVQFVKQMKYDIDLENIESCAISSATEYEKIEKSTTNITKSEITEQNLSSKLTENYIEKTASSIVDDSITKAISVAEEIKKEIDVELGSSEVITSNVQAKDVKKLIETIDKTTEDIATKKLRSKISEKYDETISEHEEIKKSSARQEVEETIVSGTVKSLSASYEHEAQTANVKALDERNKQPPKVNDIKMKEKEVRKDGTFGQNRAESKVSSSCSVKSAHKSEKLETKSDIQQKKSTTRLLAEQRAYTIGLQTIPKIKGQLHSSYHYNLLLKTFFIHLTDVMVALSRFILAEPVLDNEAETQENTTEKTVSKETVNVGQEKMFEEVIKEEEAIVRDEEISEKTSKEDRAVISDHVKENLCVEIEQETQEKKTLSGSKMAQLTAKKSEELIQGMDAVITEFQNKAGIEDSNDFIKSSESKIEHEEESKTLSQITSKTNIVESKTETKEEERERRSKSREGKTIYVATVESHVYTNKDAILSEQFSETSSVQSAEEIKVAESSENIEQVSQTEVIEKSQESKSEEIKIEKGAQKKQDVQISENKIIKDVKIDEPVVEPEEITVEEKVTIPVHVPFVELSEDVEATVKIIKTISPPAEVIELEDNEFSKTSTEESQTTSGSATTEIYKSATVSEETSYQQDFEMLESSFAAKSTALKTIESSEQSSQETLQQSIELSSEGATQTKLRESLRKLSLKTTDSFPSTISTPTPASVPPTPLTDEYIFRLEAPMPKSRGPTPLPEDPKEPSPIEEEEHEDPHIVKKKLNPYIETKIERIVYDPPLATPVEIKDVPVFAEHVKVGVISDSTKEKMSEEEIREIEEKSSLLASAIDETIKNIEEYKEQVGIDFKNEVHSSEITEKYVKDASAMKICDQSKLEDISIQNTAFHQPASETILASNGYIKEANTIIRSDMKSELVKESASMEENWSNVVSPMIINTENAKLHEKSLKITKATANNISTSITDKDVTSTVLATDIIQLNTNMRENRVGSLSTTLTQKTEQTSDINKQSSLAKETKTDQSVKEFDTMQSSMYTSDNKVHSATTAQLAEESQKTTGLSTFFKAPEEPKTDPMQGYRPVLFNPEEARRSASRDRLMTPGLISVKSDIAQPRSVTIEGATLGTTQGIIDGLEDVVIDAEVAKELGKPGITEETVAEIISGESETLREAHVMGLSRVIASHMTRVDENDTSVDFKKIKPTNEKLKDSEVIKALNDELIKTKDEKKKEERKYTTFLQTPKRPMPKAKFGYHGWLPQFDVEPQDRYTVKIVKQPKPKVAPDYKPENFETGLLPWEERAAREPSPPPVPPEDPIFIPEEVPEFLEAVDPLPESAVPDLEETGISLPPEPEKTQEVVSEPPTEQTIEDQQDTEAPTELDLEKVVEETEQLIIDEMEQNRLAEQLLSNVQSMVDPNATLEEQLAQMRAQLATLAQLPGVIQQSLELVTKQLMQISQQESIQCTRAETKSESTMESSEEVQMTQRTETIDKVSAKIEETQETTEQVKPQELSKPLELVKQQEPMKPSLSPAELQRMRREEEEMIEEQRRIEKQNKVESTIEHYIYKHMNQQELMKQVQLERESRQIKEHPTPRVATPKPLFGPLTPQEHPLILPGRQKRQKPKDAYNDAFIAETLTAQAEIIQGKAKGVNFLKYEKPPVSLDHLKDSDTYKMIHNMEQAPPRRVDLLTPVVAESDYREKCRSMTPCMERRVPQEEHLDMPQQLQP